jgi:hypothetical protein
MKYNLAFIEGWPASGKTALWACLDCREEIFVEPLHVYALNSMFALDFSSNKTRKLTIREVRKALSQTEYYKTEQYSYEGSFPISFGAGMTENATFKFDWKRFDSEFINSVTSKAISAEEYIEAYIDCYLDSYHSGHFKGRVKTFVTMTNYYDYKSLFRLRNIIDFKLIYVQRSYRDIIWSRTARKARPQDGKESHHFAPKFDYLMSLSEVQNIFAFDKFNRDKSNVYLTIELSELLKQTELSLKKVVSYLGIEWRQEFLLETRDGSLISSRYKLTSHSNDVPSFSFWQRCSLGVHYFLAKYFKFKFNPFSLKAIIIFSGTTIRKYLK